MKKEERLHRLFGDIDDGLVAEATRRPVRKAVWVPIVAAAACVALTVGLWQGGVFDRAEIPVEAPNEGTTTTVNTTVPADTDVVTDTADTTADTTTTTTEKSSTTEKPTTGSTAKPTTTTTTAKPTTTEKPTTGSTAKPTTATTTAKPTTTTTTAKPTTVKPTTKTEPTKTTEKPTTTAKPTTTTNTTTARPTTTATTTITNATEPYILVGGEEPKGEISTALIPSLNDRLVSKTLEEKMKEYRDVNAVFQVVVYSVRTQEDVNNCSEARDADEEWLSLEKQYEAARKALKEADKRLDDCEYPEDDPRRDELWQERNEAAKKKQEISNKQTAYHSEFSEKYYDNLKKERISYASKFCKKGPISGYGPYGNGYYMELTADAINELADRGGYGFKLTTEKKREDAKYEAVNA